MLDNVRYLEITAQSEVEARTLAERELSTNETITDAEVLSAPARGMFGVIGDPTFRIRFAIGAKTVSTSSAGAPTASRSAPSVAGPTVESAVTRREQGDHNAVSYQQDDLDEDEPGHYHDQGQDHGHTRDHYHDRDRDRDTTGNFSDNYSDLDDGDLDFSEEDHLETPPRKNYDYAPQARPQHSTGHDERPSRNRNRNYGRNREQNSDQDIAAPFRTPAELMLPTHPTKQRHEVTPALRENPMYATIHDAIHEVADAVGAGETMIDDCMVDDVWLIEINGNNMSQLIGKRGRTLDALQYILNICWNKGNEERQKLVLDVQGYREKRHRGLLQLANRMLRKVLDSGRPVELEPMSTLDRRTIHLALKDRSGIETFSKGVEPMRRVIISPRKGMKPRRQASGAGNTAGTGAGTAPTWNSGKPRRRPPSSTPATMPVDDRSQPLRSRSVPMFIEEDPDNDT